MCNSSQKRNIIHKILQQYYQYTINNIDDIITRGFMSGILLILKEKL